MLTVLQAINLSTEYLERKGIESPRLNSELLLASILNCKRFDLYLKFDQPLKEEETNLYREYISRRGKHEPLQYITGKVEFYGLEFIVNSSVLIPRQETEILLETIINKYNMKDNLKIFDVGAGSGNIPITLAKHLNGKFVSIDISKDALKTAKDNAVLNNVDDKIDFIFKDIFDEARFPENEYDIVVANPPYVEVKEYSNLQEEIIAYEPRIAVTDENNGYSFYERITEVSAKCLKKGGRLFFEMAKGQSNRINNILQKNGFTNIEIIKDYQQIDRVIYGEKL